MPVNLDVIGKKLDASVYDYGEKDVILYALGVGCGRENLKFVYEQDLQVLPTFAVIPAFPALFAMGSAMQVNPMMVLHGEQRIELHGPIPTSGKLTTTPTVTAIYDKIKGALIVTETETVDAKGKLLFKNVFGTFARGEGGFGGDRGPSGQRNAVPDRKPDTIVEMKTLPQQALIYRLSGDMNPLHADPSFAKMGGFDTPILHGLCTYGIVCKAAVDTLLDGDVSAVSRYKVRFAGVVFPGETVITSMWREGDRIVLSATTKERGQPVLANAAIWTR